MIDRKVLGMMRFKKCADSAGFEFETWYHNEDIWVNFGSAEKNEIAYSYYVRINGDTTSFQELFDMLIEQMKANLMARARVHF